MTAVRRFRYLGGLGATLVILPATVAGEARAATTSFAFTGTTQTFTVPAGVTSVNVVAIGGRGGTGGGGGTTPGGPGGFGARAEADIPVTLGQVLFVRVGGNGATGKSGPPRANVDGGFNGGGDSGSADDNSGGGGGGASDVRTIAPGDTGTLGSRVIVAGGGGGGNSPSAGTNTGGGAGGAAGADGSAGTVGAPGQGGVAATTTGPGTNPDAAGENGGTGVGGDGGVSSAGGNAGSGGGGGGGLFGGGGGGGGNNALNSSGSGGGGGSSGFVAAAVNTSIQVDTTANPRVVFTYPGPAVPPDDGTPPPDDGTSSNEFSFGQVKRNKKRGTAKLPVEVPGPGEVELAKTKKVKKDTEQIELTTAGTGQDGIVVKLTVKPRGKAKKKLNSKGKATVKANVTYTPDRGSPNTEDKKIKLVKRA